MCQSFQKKNKINIRSAFFTQTFYWHHHDQLLITTHSGDFSKPTVEYHCNFLYTIFISSKLEQSDPYQPKFEWQTSIVEEFYQILRVELGMNEYDAEMYSMRANLYFSRCVQ
jgi:hypothetical protein